ncbi:MAG: hypothetical protein H7326_07635 [Bdellovibrionaceae bacterium]|nr:hypothetical protein [Pseudobdellovibrionaceae bacterium]
MKIPFGLIFVMMFAPIAHAQSDVEFQQLEAETAVVDSDAAKEEAEEAKRMQVQENQRHSELKAEARASIKEAKALQAKAARETARALKEADRTKSQPASFEKAMKDNMMAKAKAERKIQESSKKIAKALQRREELKAQKLASDKKAKEVTEKAKKAELELKKATAAEKLSEAEAKSSKQKVKLAQAKYEQLQRHTGKKLKLAKANKTRYIAEAKKNKKAKHKIDKSIAMVQEE